MPANIVKLSYREALRRALREEMRRDENVYMIGEDSGDSGSG